MRTDCELWNKHIGHELQVPGEEYPQTISISWMGSNKTGTFKCPKCNLTEEILRTGKICEHHEYGEHIEITCKKCREVGNTKNVGHIGNRHVFITCRCLDSDFIHICDFLQGGIRR